MWVRGFLDRADMARRKITTEDKIRPSEAEIITQMKIGQDKYVSMGIQNHQVWNMDETAVTWCIGPTHMFVPKTESARAKHQGVSNLKLRITAAITVNGAGDFAPLFMIIRHSAAVTSQKRPNQASIRVIQKLYKDDNGFGQSDGWKLDLWEKVLSIEGVTSKHSCWYVKNRNTRHVITSQHKAWNDTVRMMMFVDLILKDIKDADGKLLLWMDNCGPHKTDEVSDFIKESGVETALLPPNMTDLLQVLDLVVNGPLKRHTRTLRANRIVDCFKEYKLSLERLGDQSATLPAFKPPKPMMQQSMQDLISLVANEFSCPTFKDGVKRSFIKTGMSKNVDGQFVKYETCQSTLNMKIEPTGTIKEDTSNNEDNAALQHSIIESAVDNFLDQEPNSDEELDSDSDDDENNDDDSD